MTNKTTHHLNQRVSHQQADTLIVQQLPTDGLVLTGKRTTNGGHAGLSHTHPLDAEHIVISRVSVHKPAQQTPGRPEAGPTHIRLTEKGRECLLHRREGVLLPPTRAHVLTSFGTSSSKHPDTGDNRHTVVAPQEGRAPGEPSSSRKAFTHTQRPPRGVRQDKGVLTNAASASLQPAPDTKSIRVQSANNTVVRSQTASGARRKSGRITLWGIEPAVMSELERIAAEEGLSLSLIGKTALTQWVHQSLHDKHEDTLYPTIRSLVREENRTLGNRLVFFQMRTAFAAEQTRILTTNILSRFLKYLGVPDEIFNNLVDQSNKMAKRNIIARNPDFKSLIEEWWQSEPDQKTDERVDGKRKINTKPNRKEKR